MSDSAASALPRRIPESFFEKLPDVPAQTTITDDLHKQARPNSHVPSKAMMWYDAIVDDMISNPGTTLKATAARLGRSPVTIGYIVNSDLFKARYAQRRDQFNEELDSRLIGKLGKVAELSLDLTLESLEKKRTAVPLPQLHDIADKALNRLGYGVKESPAASVAVTVNNQNNGAVQQVATPVSAEALAAARDNLRSIEEGRATAARQLPQDSETKMIELAPAPSSGSRGEG